MAHAEKCPVCGGSGGYKGMPDPGSTVIIGPWITCHGCSGRGWVTVQDEEPPVYHHEPRDDRAAKLLEEQP